MSRGYAQHVAVKRALEGLQRQGKVIGLDRQYCRDDRSFDGRSERGYCWMSERGAQQWVHAHAQSEHPRVKDFKAKMRAIGMKLK